MFIKGETIDDLIRLGLEHILEHGDHISPSKKDALETIGMCFKLTNPLARFSRTESRSVVSSALGETLWYLSGSDEFSIIEHYISAYKVFCETPSDVKVSEAAYGPRLKSQMDFILKAAQKNDSRRAVICIYRQSDQNNRFEVPCTCTLQFFPRSGVLHALAHMRSNDIYTGMPHDIFAFTFLQEYLARSARLEIGTYIHQVGSLHLYNRDEDKARRYLASGIADSVPMDPMPNQNPSQGLDWLLNAEAKLRNGETIQQTDDVEPYWRDLANLLRVKPLREAGERKALEELKGEMNSFAFRTFLQDEIERA